MNFLNLNDESMRQAADFAKDWAQIHGICTRLNDQADRSDLARIQAFTLAPSCVPIKLYNQAYNVQKFFGLLYHRIPYDYHFMRISLKKVIEVDEFTRNLFKIYEDVYQKESSVPAQPVTLTIQRADYMFHCPPAQDSSVTAEGCLVDPDACVLKQVEVNTMASGAAGIACEVARLHSRILRRFPDLKPRLPGRLADNRALDNVARGIVQAWKVYGDPQALLLFVVEGLDLNAMDQRLTEFKVAEMTDYAAKSVRYTLKQIAENFYVDEKCGRKLKSFQKNQEVGLVYFRSGYAPSQYPTEIEWSARYMLERSAAIKCPWIGAQLAGSKKIQQILTNPRVALEFMGDQEAVNKITETFAEIISLDVDDPRTESVVKMALKQPERYVLKPQREGGGNNLFDSALAKKLELAPPQELDGYILMERLRPLRHENVLVRANQPLKLVHVDSELGTFGYVLGSSSGVVIDQAQYGHLFRTKPAKDNEGGTIKGTAGHDAPFLIC